MLLRWAAARPLGMGVSRYCRRERDGARDLLRRERQTDGCPPAAANVLFFALSGQNATLALVFRRPSDTTNGKRKLRLRLIQFPIARALTGAAVTWNLG